MTTQTETIRRTWRFDPPEIDTGYPQWARRSNPVVRRHLGIYAKTIPPRVGLLVTLFGMQTLLVLASMFVPLLFGVLRTMIVLSMFVLPIGWYFYAQTALLTAKDSVANMQREKDNKTMALLRATPFSLREILLGKIAAAMWRQVQDLNLVLVIATFVGLPPILVIFADAWDAGEYGYVYFIGVALTFGASILRVVAEFFMIGALGQMTAVSVPTRGGATVVALGLAAFYFLLINLLRLLPMSLPMGIVVQALLPLALPVFISWIALRLTERHVTEG